jgi:uncharacterized membrane protein YeaQ/YmgE (transglycosylase-associated protein family)
MALLRFLLLIFVTGWVAGRIARGQGFGWVVNFILGILCWLTGAFMCGLLGITEPAGLGSIEMSLIGTVTVLFLFSFIRFSKKKALENE